MWPSSGSGTGTPSSSRIFPAFRRITSSTAPSTGLLAPYISVARTTGLVLAEAIDATFALLVASGIPREVVVHDRVEVLLRLMPSDRQSVATSRRRSASPSSLHLAPHVRRRSARR